MKSTLDKAARMAAKASKASLGGIFASQKGLSRGLFTQAGKKKEERIACSIWSFDSSTILGKPVKDLSLWNMLWDLPKTNFVARGQSTQEPDDPLNRKVRGLIGNRSPIKFKPDGTIDKAATDFIADEHQRGNIHGLSTSQSAYLAFSFSGNLAPGNHMILGDRSPLLIPQQFQIFQRYDPNTALMGTDGEPRDLSYEREITFPGLPGFAIPMVIDRPSMFKFTFKLNPLYVDIKTLPETLQKEIQQLGHDFQMLSCVVRTMGLEEAEPLIEKFQKAQEKFFEKYCDMDFINSDQDRVAAIETELRSMKQKPGIEPTPDSDESPQTGPTSL